MLSMTSTLDENPEFELTLLVQVEVMRRNDKS